MIVLAGDSEHCSLRIKVCHVLGKRSHFFGAAMPVFRIIDLIGRHRILPPSSCSSALTRLRVGRFDKRHDITNFPQAIDHASGYRGRHAQRLMDADEIVIGCEQCDGPSVIFKPLAKRIRQSRESSRVHPDVQVLPFGKRRANVLRVRVTFDPGLDRASAFGRAIATLRTLGCCP